MSTAIDVLLDRRNLISIEKWQQAIDAHGFSLELPKIVGWETFSGYIPCWLDGNETGFELDTDDVSVTAYATEIFAEQRDYVGHRDLCTGFSVPVGENEYDLRAAVIASSVLAAATEGTLWVECEPVPPDDYLRWGRSMLHELSQHFGASRA